MANWTALTFAYGTLLTSTQMTQLFDNITAAFEKASGAPVLASKYITTNMYADYQAGSYMIGMIEQTILAPSSFSSYHEIARFTLPKGGTVRCQWDMHAEEGETIYGRIYRNGVAIGVQRYAQHHTWSTYYEDISSWTAGDRLQLYTYVTNPSNNNLIHNISIRVASADFAVCGQAF